MSSILYTLPNDIHVVGEYSPSKSNPYARVRILKHHLFDAVVKLGCQQVRKNRVVMISVLGRKLLISELVHHKNDNREDDLPDNLELISPADHNKHHKIGTKKSDESKAKTSESVKGAYLDGRMDHKKYLQGTEQTHAKLNSSMVIEIRKSKLPSRQLARIYGVSKTVILKVKNNQLWRHVS